jgi:hypothetical protein
MFGGIGLKTYSVGITIMALAEYGRVTKVANKEDDRYGGDANGGTLLEKPDLEWMRKLTAWLLEQQQRNGGWRYPMGGHDLSNTQYAVLALKSASSVGIKVPDEAYAKALRYLLDLQQKNGKKVARYEEVGGDGVYAAQREKVPGFDRARGWGYTAPNPDTGSMTTAGVASVAICIQELRGKRWAKARAQGEQSVRDGIAWLGENFTVTQNPGSGMQWHYYYLYGLERAGVLAGRKWIGNHDWYREGAEYLLDRQSGGGGWRGDILETCFALLFLKRSTTPVALTGLDK